MSQKEVQQKINETIVCYQETISRYFEKNQRLKYPDQEVPFRFKNSKDYVISIVCFECKETFILMKVKYIIEDKFRYFKSKIELVNKRKRKNILVLNKWGEVSESEYKNLTLVKKNK